MVDQIQTFNGQCVTKDGVVPSGTDATCCCASEPITCTAGTFGGPDLSTLEAEITVTGIDDESPIDDSWTCVCSRANGTFIIPYYDMYTGSQSHWTIGPNWSVGTETFARFIGSTGTDQVCSGDGIPDSFCGVDGNAYVALICDTTSSYITIYLQYAWNCGQIFKRNAYTGATSINLGTAYTLSDASFEQDPFTTCDTSAHTLTVKFNVA